LRGKKERGHAVFAADFLVGDEGEVDGPAGEEGRKGGVLLLEAFDGEDVLGADAFHVLGAAVGLRRGEDDGGEGEEELIN